MSANHRHLPRPSAYLWGRCEGWAKIGVYHAVVVDAGRGEALDEKGKVLLLRGADGMWIEPEKEGGMHYDKCAVTHLPVDPGTMGKEGWLEKWVERNVAREKRLGSRNAAPPESSEGRGHFFNKESKGKTG